MHATVNPLLVLVLLLNLFMLGTSRLRAAVNASAMQGVLLGALAVLVHSRVSLGIVLLALGAALVKGVVIPGMLRRALREVAVHREIEPYIGFILSMLLGTLAAGASLVFAGTLPLAAQHVGSLLVPAAVATVLTGFIQLTTRRKAISQVVGYLTLENGIYVFGLTLFEAMPLFVELGVLLDLFVGIFVMGIVINHINREFSSLDTAHLSQLKEE